MESQNCSVTIIVPALNEQENLSATIESIVKSAPEKLEYEIIIFNDGSTDNTGKIAESIAKENSRVRVVHHQNPKKLGACFREGVELAKGTYALMLPGDDETHVETIKNLFNSVGLADIVATYTVNKNARSFTRRIISATYTFVINILFGLRMKYYNGPSLIRVDLLKKLPPIPSGFAYMASILVRLIKAGYKYVEIEMIIKSAKGRKSRALSWKNLQQVNKTILDLFIDVNIKKKYFYEK